MKLNEKGKMFEDGIVRWYDQTSHRWLSQEEINKQDTADKFVVGINWIGYVLAGLAFLWMAFVTFSSI